MKATLANQSEEVENNEDEVLHLLIRFQLIDRERKKSRT